jgi:hypothetical protein
VAHRLLYFGALFYGSRPLRFWLNGDAVLSLGLLAEMLEATRKPYFEKQDALNRIRSRLTRLDSFPLNWVRYPITIALISTPNLLRAFAQSAETETYLKLNLLALGIKQYREEHGPYRKHLRRWHHNTLPPFRHGPHYQ